MKDNDKILNINAETSNEPLPFSPEDVEQLLKTGSNYSLPDFSYTNCRDNEEDSLASLLAQDIEKDVVRNYFVEEKVDVSLPCFVIDLSDTPVLSFSLQALQNFLYNSEDDYCERIRIKEGAYDAIESNEEILKELRKVTVYIQTQEKLLEIGFGDQSQVTNILSKIVHEIFPKETKLYKNYGKGFQEVSRVGVSHIKLNI